MAFTLKLGYLGFITAGQEPEGKQTQRLKARLLTLVYSRLVVAGFSPHLLDPLRRNLSTIDRLLLNRSVVLQVLAFP